MINGYQDHLILFCLLVNGLPQGQSRYYPLPYSRMPRSLLTLSILGAVRVGRGFLPASHYLHDCSLLSSPLILHLTSRRPRWGPVILVISGELPVQGARQLF